MESIEADTKPPITKEIVEKGDGVVGNVQDASATSNSENKNKRKRRNKKARKQPQQAAGETIMLDKAGGEDVTDIGMMEQNSRKKPKSTPIRLTARPDTDQPYAYYHLRIPPAQCDMISLRTTLTNSLSRLLGIQGTAILDVDILKLDSTTGDAWVRVAGSPGHLGPWGAEGFGVAVSGGVGGVEGMRVVKGGRWLVGVAGVGEDDLWGE
ncbi:hypothetical protein BDZ91DRAFT_844193 [Kalaharituber pfeilii]|nr:hypothetical protein BDZ91DRAFT_844193 [Kalaharituber pfeilii]